MKPSMGKLSASEKEKTKIRERNRRSITTKIFQGLRKYGGYNLAPRADINEVLRCLAAEAGWTVEEDGTTYRTQAPGGNQMLRQLSGGRLSFSGGTLSGINSLMNSASRGGSLSGGASMLVGSDGAVCGGSLAGGGGTLGNGIGSSLITPGAGLLGLQQLDVGGYLDSRGGDCSTTASPRHQPAVNSGTLFSPHHAAVAAAAATPTPTSSISLMPVASPFASPTSSEVYPNSSSRSTITTSTLAPIPLIAPTQQLFNTAFPSYAGNYYVPSSDPSPSELKDDLLDALPLEYCQHQNLIAVAAMAARGQGQQHLLPEQQHEQEQERSVSSMLGQLRANNIGARNSTYPPFIMFPQQQVHPFMQEARASNHNTPLGSPQHHN
ncbi:hypothetical protein KP509_10G045400 [Ceratopteris richardii]|uniref:BES1/BZR1 plant transcription factor N-terminal domain-containing protein n=1 Tax=Ceratopteris richardii TaxID=49495 RepID=A0A8T2TX23_CERRI|nr:hypothetical protein KP509_10G045400 [Ceratopteris richardii]